MVAPSRLICPMQLLFVWRNGSINSLGRSPSVFVLLLIEDSVTYTLLVTTLLGCLFLVCRGEKIVLQRPDYLLPIEPPMQTQLDFMHPQGSFLSPS